MSHPENIKRIVILNTGLFSGRESSVGLDAWLAYARAQTDLDVGALVSRACGGLPEDVVPGYDAPFPDVTYKAGALAFPRLVPTRIEDEGAAEQLDARQALDAWDGPTTVAFGADDPIFPPAVGASWAKRLRRCSGFTSIAGAGHFVQEMAPGAVARAVLDAI
jgi:haloalkane dehalogenase